MARVYYYVMFAVLISMMITIVGIEGANDGGLLEQVGLLDLENGQVDYNSQFLIKMLEVLGLTILGGLTVGLIFRVDTSLIMSTFLTAVLAVTFIGALWNIILITAQYPEYISIPVIFIMAPFTIGYVFSLYEHFRSNV